MPNNTAYLFYKEYFKGIDLRQFVSADQKKVKERNSARFERRNKAILNNKPTRRELELLNYWKEKPAVECFDFETTYPGMLIGSGYIHETGAEGEYKLGAFFDHTSGWPVVPGSSIKGTLRSFFPGFDPQKENLLLADWRKADEKQKSKAKYIWYLIHRQPLADFEEKNYQSIFLLEQTLFAGWNPGKIKDKEAFLPMSSRAVFFDAVPDESMAGKTIFADDSITPHGKDALKSPIPLLFLKVAPGVQFNFYFKLPDALFDHLDFNKEQVLDLFKTLLEEHGLGAKTNVGYGKLKAPPEPVVFKKDQIVEGKLVDKERRGNRFDLHFEIEGNPQRVKANVKEPVYYNYEIGDQIKDLKVSSITPQGIIKYVKVTK